MKEDKQRQKNTPTLRLTVEPVPKPAANKSLKNRLGSRWVGLRKEVFARYDHQCGVCGIAPTREERHSRLECHEDWAYDELARVQRLDGLISLCARCHHVKHWGWAKKRVKTVKSFQIWQDEEKLAAYREGNCKGDGAGNWVRVPLLEDHFMAVNGCDLETMRDHVLEAAEKWNRRSQIDWQTDYGEYDGLLI
jgi:hypothetical protein